MAVSWRLSDMPGVFITCRVAAALRRGAAVVFPAPRRCWQKCRAARSRRARKGIVMFRKKQRNEACIRQCEDACAQTVDTDSALPSYARTLSWLSLVVILLTSLGLSFFISNDRIRFALINN